MAVGSRIAHNDVILTKEALNDHPAIFGFRRREPPSVVVAVYRLVEEVTESNDVDESKMALQSLAS
jgi:hypothetical protein